MLLFLFSAGCSLSESETSEVIKIIEIREAKLNAGDIKSVALLVADNYPDRKEYLEQLNLQQQYFSNYSYDINSTSIKKVSIFHKEIEMEIDYDLSYRSPQDAAPAFWLGRKEKVVLVKEKIGWKIAEIKDIADAGRKVDPQTVHDIFFALDTRKTALNNGDSELFKTVIDEKYPGREELIDNFKKNSEAFINVNYSLTGRKFQYVSPQKDEARVVQYFNLLFKIKGLDQTEKVEDQREIISLKQKEKGIWAIVDGLK